MQNQQVMQVQQIELARLVPHPKNANVMSSAVMAKLRRHIERTGRYEPLIVRPHPTQAGCFELINGHHRKQILESLGHTHAACLVWNLCDRETLLLLATVNRLGGEDSPGKRLNLLESLAGAMAVTSAELAKLLPEEASTLAKLLGDSALPPIADAPVLANMPEAFTVFLSHEDKTLLLAALACTDRDPAVAIMKWARKN